MKFQIDIYKNTVTEECICRPYFWSRRNYTSLASPPLRKANEATLLTLENQLWQMQTVQRLF